MMMVIVSSAENEHPLKLKLSSLQVVALLGSTEALWQEVPEASSTWTLMSLLELLVELAQAHMFQPVKLPE